MTGRVVVVGAGQAGASLAGRLRALGHEGPVTLIGAEPLPPYQRPPLSKKFLLGELERERLFLRPENFYVENAIDTRFGAPVTAIDRAAREVVVDGARVAYDRLALTLGARVRRLPAAIGGDLDGVYEIRTVGDVERMAHEIVGGRRALVVGGGYIGLETAAALASRGISVTLIELAERILQRVAASETSAFIRALHRDHGVDLREGVGLERLLGKHGRVGGAALADGSEITADFVVVGIGIEPEIALAEAAGLEIDDGIATDAQCRTSDPVIFAAGDCASFPRNGARLRLESVQNAIDQAEHAAGAILGGDAPYAPEPWFWSDQYDCKLQIAGLNRGHDRTVVRPGSRPGGRSVWYYRGDRLLAVDAMNDPKAYMQAKRWIAAGSSPDPDQVSDGSVDLRTLVRNGR